MTGMRQFLAVLFFVAGVSGCETVEPWQRGTLAKQEMQWDSDLLEANLRSQIHNSKEASSGGAGAAGGGCGCN